MNIQDFEAWVARRDPDWYLKSIEEIFGMVSTYKDEECLSDGAFPKYLLAADMHAAKKQASKPQLPLF